MLSTKLSTNYSNYSYDHTYWVNTKYLLWKVHYGSFISLFSISICTVKNNFHTVHRAVRKNLNFGLRVSRLFYLFFYDIFSMAWLSTVSFSGQFDYSYAICYCLSNTASCFVVRRSPCGDCLVLYFTRFWKTNKRELHIQ